MVILESENNDTNIPILLHVPVIMIKIKTLSKAETCLTIMSICFGLFGFGDINSGLI